MNPLHKALYRSFLNSDSEPDERQERIINAELARCLIYLYWFNFILLLIMFAHDRLEGVFMSTVTIVLLINFAFVMIFTLTNEHCQELRGQEIDITLQSLPQYLEYHKKWAIIFGAYMSSLIITMNFEKLAFAVYQPLNSILFIYSYGLLMGASYYRRSKKEALKILAAKQAVTTDSETDKEA